MKLVRPSAHGHLGSPPTRCFAALVALALVPPSMLWSCARNAPSATLASAAPSPQAVRAAPPDTKSDGVDLSITFHPGITGNVGWVKLPEPLTLEFLGNPGATVVEAREWDWGPSADKTLAGQVRAVRLRAAKLEDTALNLDAEALCSPELRAEVNRQRPSRLLVRMLPRVTSEARACLASLDVPRLYVGGCLYRAHSPFNEGGCEADVELEALANDPDLRERVRGLSASIARADAVELLARFPRLEYLALAKGAQAEPEWKLIDALPFAALPELRYLDLSTWTEGVELLRPETLQGLARLHTLRWTGRLVVELPEGCQLRRYGQEVLRPEDLESLGACSRLEELSSDDAPDVSLAAVSQLTRLRVIHLRHVRAQDLSPLAVLSQLEVLNLPASHSTDFDVLARLPTLRRIDLSQTSIADLSVLRDLTELRALDLSMTPVADLSPLGPKPNLSVLNIGASKVSDLSAMRQFPALRELFLGDTPVSSLGPLRGHPALSWVVLYGTGVRDVDVLFSLPKLTRVNIGSLALPPEQVAKLEARLGVGNVDRL